MGSMSESDRRRFDLLSAELDSLDRKIASELTSGSLQRRLRDRRLSVWQEAKEILEGVDLVAPESAIERYVRRRDAYVLSGNEDDFSEMLDSVAALPDWPIKR